MEPQINKKIGFCSVFKPPLCRHEFFKFLSYSNTTSEIIKKPMWPFFLDKISVTLKFEKNAQK